MDRIKAVLFDLDDTLFDRQQAQHQLLHGIVTEFNGLFDGLDGEDVAEAFLEADRIGNQAFSAGASADASLRIRGQKFLELLGLSPEPTDSLTAAYSRLYPYINAPVSGVRVVLTSLAERFQLGIVSNSTRELQYQKLETLGLRHLFQCIVLSEDLGIRKPDPAIFLNACRQLSRKPEECLFVGDSYDVDVLGAKRARMRSCWFNRLGLTLAEKDPKPDIEIHALAELTNILICQRQRESRL